MLHHYKRFIATAVCLITTSIIVGCGGGSSSNNTESRAVSTAPKQVGDLSFVLSSPRGVYKRGETMDFTLTIHNTGWADVTYSYRHRAVDFSFCDDNRIIHYRPPITADYSPRRETISHGKQKVYTFQYHIPESGTSLLPGEYRMAGWLGDPKESADGGLIPSSRSAELLPVRIVE